MSNHDTDSQLRIFAIPEKCKDGNPPRLLGNAILIKDTDQYSRSKTEGGLYIAGGEDIEKKYALGEVISIGPDVKEVKVTDIVMYQKSTAYRMPNGAVPTCMRVLTEVPVCIQVVMPNDPSSAIGTGGKASE